MSERGSGAKGIGDYRLGRRQFLAGSAGVGGVAPRDAGARLRSRRARAVEAGLAATSRTHPNGTSSSSTTSPQAVLRATQYGIEDAEALLGTTSQWTGSEKAVVSEMVDAMNTAISGNANGTPVSVVDPVAFNDPIQKAG